MLILLEKIADCELEYNGTRGLGGVEVIQLEFSFMSTSLSEFSSLVEGLLWVGEADVSNFPEADPAVMITRLVCTGPQ